MALDGIMRQLDRDDTPGLGPKVEPASAAKPILSPEQWTPIVGQPGYVRSDTGAIKHRDPLTPAPAKPVVKTSAPDPEWPECYLYGDALLNAYPDLAFGG